jgi:metal-responsive CopG/Arc/MetJ family transcriptional regulator
VRPEISEELEQLIEQVAEDNGFRSNTEFVRHATREYALKLKQD